MQTASAFIAQNPCTASLIRKGPVPRARNPGFRNRRNNRLRCRAASSITDFDLYDLLGIDSSSDQSQIKLAYRSLQKRCHPDIAGPPGHDMAIILNEAYSVLSNPNSRLAYDKEQEKIAELRGYTGKPVYSVWFGSEREERAVFVDEVKCIGCLKCALFADKTFAIESVYGRARVVAQWADPEHKILAAIETCPVDCISMVGRSDLAALEFLMTKQPRGNVRVGMGNTAGARVSNIFVDVKKFQNRVKDASDKASTQDLKETDLKREARVSAIQAIRAISNWLYWQTPSGGRRSSTQGEMKLIPASNKAHKSTQPNIDKLRDAVAARKQLRASSREHGTVPKEEYWKPTPLALPASTHEQSTSRKVRPDRQSHKQLKESSRDEEQGDAKVKKVPTKRESVIRAVVPSLMAVIASNVIVWLQRGEGGVGELREHAGGSFALGIVNSSWSQIILAGFTWYIIGMIMVEIVDAIGGRGPR